MSGKMLTGLTVSVIGNGGYLAAALGGAGRGSCERTRVVAYRVARQVLNDSARLNKGWSMLDATLPAE